MTIKISELGNLATFTDSTLLPVVDTSNTFITVKSTGSTLKNYVLSNVANFSTSGNITTAYFYGNGVHLTGVISSYADAQVAAYLPTYSGSIGGTLTSGAQLGVTQVGNLVSLSVSGNVTVGNTYIPANVSSIGTRGQISFDSTNIYVCIATNTWRRANLVVW